MSSFDAGLEAAPERLSSSPEVKDGSPQDKPDFLASLKLVSNYMDGVQTKLILSVLLATLSVLLELVPVWIVYRITSLFIAGDAFSFSTIALYAGAAFLAIIMGYAALGLALGQSHVVAFDTIFNLRMALARHMAQLPMGYFGNRKSGDAKKLVVDEPEKLELILAHGLPEGISAIGTWLAVSVWLFIIDWRMALASIVAAPISLFLMILGMKRGANWSGAYQAAGARMNGSIVEYLAGMPVIKIFNRTGESFAETRDAVFDYAEIETKWARAFIPYAGTFFSLVLSNLVFIVPTGLFLLAANEITLSTFAFFVILGANYSTPLLKLFNLFHELAHISMGSERVLDLLAAEKQADSKEHVELDGHDIHFDNVYFGYDEHDILHGVSFTARQGEVTALVGPSGSGKSTIASLIPRFSDIRTGRICIGETDIRTMSIEQLMETVAFVFQNTFLFSDTIAANIRFGKPDATDAEVEAAARAAQAHAFISELPDGYGTHLGEQAGTLSGGERQRIAIARAILKDAPVVVLDEATAFADPDNEAAIQEAIEALTLGRTLIIIAHRLHTIADADQIVVIDKGRVAESGCHDALVAKGTLYATLWRDYTAAQTISLRSDSNDIDENQSSIQAPEDMEHDR